MDLDTCHSNDSHVYCCLRCFAPLRPDTLVRQCACADPCLRLGAKTCHVDTNPAGIGIDAASNSIVLHVYVPSGATKLRSVRGASKDGLCCAALCRVALYEETHAPDGSYSGRTVEQPAIGTAPFTLHGKMSKVRTKQGSDA